MSWRSSAGFGLAELVIVAGLVVVTAGVVLSLVTPSQGLFQAQPEVSDLQQRLRVGVDALTRDLLMAGAGPYADSKPGPLSGFFAPIQPARHGSIAAYDDGPEAVTEDAITVFYVPPTATQTTLVQPVADVGAPVVVKQAAGCPIGQPLCGMGTGTTVLLWDDGAYDAATVVAVDAAAARIRHNQQGDLSTVYQAGAAIAEAQQHVYFLNKATNELVHYDGDQAIAPVLDNVVGLKFEYFGDPEPPALRNPGSDETTTYGPMPPLPGLVQRGWPPGENCTFRMVDGQQIARLAVLGSGTDGLVAITPAMLRDGPWCPDAANSNRFDADLLRVRRVRVTLRVQTGNAALRGALTAGPDALFINQGTSADGVRRVPDQQVRFDVAPRNLNLSR